MSYYKDYQTESAVAAALAAESSLLDHEYINGQTVLINPNAKVLNLEQFEAGRQRKRGTFATTDIDSFADYIETNAQPEHISVFIDKNQMQAVAILNFDADDFEQGHLDHRAVLNAERTVMFKKLVSMHDMGRCKQKVFAEFLEDWGHKVVARDADGNEIENAKAINAVRSMRIDESAQITARLVHAWSRLKRKALMAHYLRILVLMMSAIRVYQRAILLCDWVLATMMASQYLRLRLKHCNLYVMSWQKNLLILLRAVFLTESVSVSVNFRVKQ